MRGPVKFGKYYLIERVNVGGMAEVFKGVSYGVEGFERLFAVKRVLPNIAEDREFIEMFIDEAKIAVQLNHANIGQIFELGNAEDSYFIAMEFVQGKDLRAIFDRSRNDRSRGGRRMLEIPMVCHVIKEVCEALEYAHNKKNDRQMALNLVHRDVSPQNVIVSYDGEVKLIDFGIAKAAGKVNKTQAGILKGKFGYMSPEQVRGKPIDRRSDIFALGVVLFEMLTLERCFQGESDFSTLEKVRNVDIRRPSQLNREILPELERIVLRCLSRDVDERYQCAAEVQDALQKFLYQSGTFYARKDLAAFMKRTFDAELRAEQRKLSEFRAYARQHIPEARRAESAEFGVAGGDQPTAPKPVLPALSWEDEELETSVFDRSPSQIVAEMDAQPQAQRPLDPKFSRSSVPPAVAAPPMASLPPEGIPPLAPLAASRRTIPPTMYMPARKSRSRMRVLLFTLLLVLGGGAVGVWYYTRAPATAVLVIDSSAPSSVRIELDGQRVHEGPTPFRLGEVAPGQHRLRISAAGFAAIDRAIVVEGNTEVQLPVRLTPLAGDRATGLKLQTVPGGASIFVNGERLDDFTPMTVRGVPPGKTQLRFEKTGYLPWEGTVRVNVRGLTEVKAVTLKPAKVSILFLSEPPRARLTLIEKGQQVKLGQTPYRLAEVDNNGAKWIVAELEGYETVKRRLEPYESRKAQELIELVPASSPTPAPRRIWRRSRRSNGGPATGCVGEDCPDRHLAPAPPPLQPPEPIKPVGPGYLSISASPAALVFIDGKEIKWTPVIKYGLPAGPHRVTLVRDRPPTYRREATVHIKSQETKLHRYTHPK